LTSFSVTHLNGFLDIPFLVLRVHRHELEDHQVEGSGDDGQAEHDEEEGKGDVLGLVLQRVILMEKFNEKFIYFFESFHLIRMALETKLA